MSGSNGDGRSTRLWGPQTERALHSFRIGIDRFRWGRPVIRALGVLKMCAARANAELGRVPTHKADLIARAAKDVIDGKLDNAFPLVAFQTGSGAQTNTNANEVIAKRAIALAEEVDGIKLPIDPEIDVNHGQSSNDAFPTIMHLATVEQVEDVLLPVVRALRATLAEKADNFEEIVIVGRTHLQDAAPLTLGQVFSCWEAQLDDAIDAIERTLPALYRLAIGGMTVGTGMSSHRHFGGIVARKIADEMRKPFVGAPNKFSVISAHDAMVNVSAALRTLAGALLKIANDVRLYTGGPRAGFGELRIAPTPDAAFDRAQCEALTMVAVHVFGADHAVAFAGSQGNFQLNAYKPIILFNVLESTQLLAEAASSFDEQCMRCIEPDEERIREHLESSLMLIDTHA